LQPLASLSCFQAAGEGVGPSLTLPMIEVIAALPVSSTGATSVMLKLPWSSSAAPPVPAAPVPAAGALLPAAPPPVPAAAVPAWPPPPGAAAWPAPPPVPATGGSLVSAPQAALSASASGNTKAHVFEA
jgi:hypothetical protein